MANTAAQLGNLLTLQAQYNEAVNLQIEWSRKYNSNSEKLKNAEKVETAWNNAYDKAMGPSNDLKYAGQTIVCAGTSDPGTAEYYANLVTPKYAKIKNDIDLLRDLDVEYDSMKTMYETLMTELQAEVESCKQSTTTSAQDTAEVGGQ